jgi:phospholipid transport system substrate-binding protein
LRRAALLLVAALAIGAPPARAQTPTEQMQQYTEHVMRLIQDATVRERDSLGALTDAVRRAALQIFGAREAARQVLGPHWAARTPGEQDEFTQLFSELLELSYLAQIDSQGGVKVRYVGELIEGDRADVRARLSTRKGREVLVEARLVRQEGRWLVWDVGVDGVSIIGNYRAQFDRIIRRGSYQDLLGRLRAKRDGLLAARRPRTE